MNIASKGIAMPDLVDLERRVTALEAAQKETAETQTWMASTLGRIAAVQDDQTKTLDRIEGRFEGVEGRLDGVESRLGKVETELSTFRRDMPSIVADAMRDFLKENR